MPSEHASAQEQQVVDQVLSLVEPPVLTMDEWLQQHQELYDELMHLMSQYATDRFGTRNNNWLRIIPAFVDRMAKDITRACESRTNDAYHGAPGVPYQSTFFEELYSEQAQSTVEQHDTGDNFLLSFNSAESKEQVMNRLRGLTSSEREWLDPWTAERESDLKPAEKQADSQQKPGVL